MLASTVGLLATDLYVPSLPTLTEVFSASPEIIQLTMTFNLVGFAVGQLFFGPLSDRFGRRTAMLLGLSLFCFAALGCALTWSAEALIVARSLLGLTGACEAVIGMYVIKELYGEEKGVKIVAIYAIFIAAAPAVGPLLGGQMLVHFGWASNFWLLLGLALLTRAAVWRFLVETAVPDVTALYPRRLLAETWLCLSVPAFWLYTVGHAASLGAIFAWITQGPFILIQQLGIPPDNFGYY
jgi:DHA1 family bicyclomycin/chloramphenicol resistance-like MFS transporter